MGRCITLDQARKVFLCGSPCPPTARVSDRTPHRRRSDQCVRDAASILSRKAPINGGQVGETGWWGRGLRYVPGNAFAREKQERLQYRPALEATWCQLGWELSPSAVGCCSERLHAAHRHLELRRPRRQGGDLVPGPGRRRGKAGDSKRGILEAADRARHLGAGHVYGVQHWIGEMGHWAGNGFRGGYAWRPAH